MAKKAPQRTTQGLRDILFDEIDALRSENGDPKRAAAVANLSKQIIGTARLELEFQSTMARIEGVGGIASKLGVLPLGSN